MLRLTLCAIAILLGFPGLVVAGPNDVFEIPRERVQRAVVTAGAELPRTVVALGSPISDMLLNLEGAIASMDAREFARLTVTARTGGKFTDTGIGFQRLAVVHLFGSGPEPVKRVELLLGDEGTIAARELEPAKPGDETKAVTLDAEKFRQVTIAWSRYRGVIEAKAEAAAVGQEFKPGEVVELSAPLVAAPMLLDQELLGDRFLAGRRSSIPAATRRLDTEKMYVRVPKGYDATRPVGLLVWVNAGPQGRPPEVFSKALDALGIACVGVANVGNDRPVADRYQLALDAIYAASAVVHVDARRVYVTGISGGGRVSTMLAACFPEYFTGSVPIVGLSNYQRVRLGNGLAAPAGFQKPTGKRFSLFCTRRVAAITGDGDFNHDEIVLGAAQMKRDGVQVRVFDYDGLGHTMPSDDQVVEALTWADEPYQEIVAKEVPAAAAKLAAVVAKRTVKAAMSAADRAELVNVTKIAPWSEPAWEAVELLRKLDGE